jgi:hypothetical protein
MARALYKMVYAKADEHLADNLVMYIDNTRQWYDSKWKDFFKNLTVKLAQGRYDHKQAVKLMLYLVERAAKAYMKEMRMEGKWTDVFDKQTRILAAEILRDDFEDTVKDSPDELKKFVPKKYAGKELTL